MAVPGCVPGQGGWEGGVGKGAHRSAHQHHPSLPPPQLPLQKHPALVKHLVPRLTQIFCSLVRQYQCLHFRFAVCALPRVVLQVQRSKGCFEKPPWSWMLFSAERWCDPRLPETSVLQGLRSLTLLFLHLCLVSQVHE